MPMPMPFASRSVRVSSILMIAGLSWSGIGCESARKDVFVTPQTLQAPAYPAFGGRAPLWAVAPLRNESGVSVVDPYEVTDRLARQIHSVSGLDAIPLNRTIAAMRALRMDEIASPGDARRLAEALGADAIVVGTMTAWDPYNPPKIGMSLALFARDGSPMVELPTPSATPDAPETYSWETAARDTAVAAGGFSDEPVSTASEHLDGSNHGVQVLVKTYASGRHDTVSALGWRRYLASMPLYTDFATFRLTERLLDAERRRVGAPIAQANGKD